ncbi:undecaprenyl/decaprenyl-phosphate alpha-N-acetylglucosaminyl 1-phosphate transferase [Candidatus Gracilibacteria bacterium]|nr:undecaprenyl/decaprenyl-phosphate alpha-N-acetylglucosaminyl 1-phosphate transferase [Candidatus Gracilibacteria bacterium]
MIEKLILIFFVSILLSTIFVYITKKLFYKLKILDNPTKYGHKRDPIPHSMGVIFVVLFFILSFFLIEHTQKLYLLWGFGLLITFVSFIDDFYFLSPKLRLLIQIIIAGIIGITSIKVGYISNIFGGVIDLNEYFLQFGDFKIYLISFLFTIFWYVFIFNSLNWSDGIVGNTAGISIISFFVIFLLGLKLYFLDNYIGGKENALFIMNLSIILIGVLIPFFIGNIKEKFLMGDSGTMFLGFILASLAIISGGKIGSVLVVFGIYAIDALYVIFKRISIGKNPLLGDNLHIHYRLLDAGLSKMQTLSIIYIFSFIFGICSLFLDKGGKIILLVIITFFVIFIPQIIKKSLKNEKK